MATHHWRRIAPSRLILSALLAGLVGLEEGDPLCALTFFLPTARAASTCQSGLDGDALDAARVTRQWSSAAKGQP